MQEPPNHPATRRDAEGLVPEPAVGGGTEKGCRSPTQPHLVPGLRAAGSLGSGGIWDSGNVKPIQALEGSVQGLMPERGNGVETEVQVPDPFRPVRRLRGGLAALQRKVEGRSQGRGGAGGGEPPDTLAFRCAPPARPAGAHLT